MKIAVIGSGIGGLSAACELAKDGHEVHIFERTNKAGGKLHEERLDGFRFDTGPSLLTMPYVIESLFQYCGKSLHDYIELIPLDPLCRYYFSDGSRFDNYFDTQKSVEELSRLNHNDALKYTDFLKKAEKLYHRTAQSFIFNPLANARDLKSLKWFDLFRIDAFSTVSEKVDTHFESEYARMFFKRFTTYNGSDPWQAPATLNVIPHVELNLGAYYIKGGMYRLADALVNLATDLNVTFHFNAHIDSIQVEEGKATGVIMNNTIHPFELIVSNSDATFTHTKLLSDKIVPIQQKKHLQKLEPSCSGFVILLGIDKQYDQLAHHTIFFSSDYKAEFNAIFKESILPDDPTIYVANTSYSDQDHAPNGGSNLFILVNAPWVKNKSFWSEQMTEAYTEKIILKLAAHGLRGLKASTRVQQVITPLEFQERWLSNRGSIYGTSSNHRLSAFLRPRNRSPFARNLYLVGGSTHPGGGIPLVMTSARHACTLIRRDFGI
jgi:phytoene desaturase